MPTKIYTTNGIFEVSDSIEQIVHQINNQKNPPFIFQSKIVDEDRKVLIMAQEIVALEESY